MGEDNVGNMNLVCDGIMKEEDRIFYGKVRFEVIYVWSLKFLGINGILLGEGGEGSYFNRRIEWM